MTMFGTPGASARTPRTSALTLSGRVTAELPVPGPRRVAGSGLLLGAGVVSVLLCALATGWLGRVLAGLVASALGLLFGPLLLVFLLAAVFPRGLGTLFLLGSLMRPRVGRGVTAVPAQASRLVVDPAPATPGLRTPRREEVLVVSPRAVPLGSEIEVLGPRVNGYRHAWMVRRTGMAGTIVAKGVCSAVVVSAASAVADLAMLVHPAR